MKIINILVPIFFGSTLVGVSCGAGPKNAIRLRNNDVSSTERTISAQTSRDAIKNVVDDIEKGKVDTLCLNDIYYDFKTNENYRKNGTILANYILNYYPDIFYSDDQVINTGYILPFEENSYYKNLLLPRGSNESFPIVLMPHLPDHLHWEYSAFDLYHLTTNEGDKKYWTRKLQFFQVSVDGAQRDYNIEARIAADYPYKNFNSKIYKFVMKKP